MIQADNQPEKIKTIFLTIETGFQSRDILRSDFYKLLTANNQLRIVLLAPAEKLDYYRENYQAANVIIETLPTKSSKNKLETLSFVLGKGAIASQTIKLHQQRGWLTDQRPWSKKLPIYLLKRISWHLGKLKIWREMIRWLFKVNATTSHFASLFKKYQPELVYTINLLNFDEFRLLKYAQEHQIKTLAYILSWDNLNSKLFIFFKADKYLVPTDFVKEELINLGDVSPKNIFVNGVIKYDSYFKKEKIISREQFFKKINCSLDKKLIVYGLSSKNTSPNYAEIIEDLHQLAVVGKIKFPHQFLIRTYPKYSLTEELINKIKQWNFIYNQPSEFFGSEKNWEIKKEDDEFLINLFYHADLIITNYCTIVIEASIFNKPVININYDGWQAKPYLLAVRRIRDYTHFRQIVKTGGERPANNKEELGQLINQYLENPDTDSQGRQRIVREQCVFTDSRSGERMYNYLVSQL